MRHFKLDELGKHPLTLADLAFIQDAYKECVLAIVSGLANQTDYFNIQKVANDNNFPNCVILSGCYFDLYLTSAGVLVPSNTYPLTEGYVVINGEVLKVNSQNITVTVNTPLSSLYWKIDEVAVAPSPVTYQNLVQKNVHLYRTASLTTDSSLAVKNASNQPISYLNTEKLKAAILNKLNLPAQSITLTSDWQNGNNSVPNPHWKIEGNRCFLYGDIKAVGTSTTVAALPLSFVRPKNNCQFLVLASNGGTSTLNFNIGSTFGWVRIDSSGIIYADPNTNNSLCLDGINFEIEPINW